MHVHGDAAHRLRRAICASISLGVSLEHSIASDKVVCRTERIDATLFCIACTSAIMPSTPPASAGTHVMTVQASCTHRGPCFASLLGERAA